MPACPFCGKPNGKCTCKARAVFPVCSFCGLPKNRVKNLVAGPCVYICDGCVRLCVEIIAEDEKVGKKRKAKKRSKSQRKR